MLLPGQHGETLNTVEVAHWKQRAVRCYLVQLGTLDEVDWRLALLALQPQDVVGVAPAQDGRPLDVGAVHAADACGAPGEEEEGRVNRVCGGGGQNSLEPKLWSGWVGWDGVGVLPCSLL